MHILGNKLKILCVHGIKNLLIDKALVKAKAQLSVGMVFATVFDRHGVLHIDFCTNIRFHIAALTYEKLEQIHLIPHGQGTLFLRFLSAWTTQRSHWGANNLMITMQVQILKAKDFIEK